MGEPVAHRQARNDASEQDDRRVFERLPGMLRRAGIEASEQGLAVMRAHFELLVRWNRKVNLTSVRDPVGILRRHFIESLFLTKVVKLGPGVLYDVGAGAGFPGLPVKAVKPEVRLVLVESNQKKVAFLKEVLREAHVLDARVEAERVENLIEGREIELADWITMRAVSGVADMLRVFRHLLVIHGQVALFLGEEDAERVSRGEPGFEWQDPVPIPDSERRVILVGQNLAGA